LAGLAAMIPGSIIYSPPVLGRKWMKEIGFTEKQLKEAGNPSKAMFGMLVTSLISGVVASTVVVTAGAETVGQTIGLSLLLAWFLVSVNLMQVFFEKRSWSLLGINAVNHVTTFLVIGLVLGLLA
jgi:Zn-dependent protease with chaperone function